MGISKIIAKGLVRVVEKSLPAERKIVTAGKNIFSETVTGTTKTAENAIRESVFETVKRTDSAAPITSPLKRTVIETKPAAAVKDTPSPAGKGKINTELPDTIEHHPLTKENAVSSKFVSENVPPEIDATLFENIETKKFPPVGGSKKKVRQNYDHYAKNHDGIMEKNDISDTQIEFKITDSKTGNILRKCTYNSNNPNINTDIFFNYGNNNKISSILEVDSNGDLKSIRQYVYDINGNKICEYKVSQDNAITVFQNGSTSQLSELEFKTEYGFVPETYNKFKRLKITNSQEQSVSKSAKTAQPLDLHKYLNDNSNITYIDIDNNTKICRKYVYSGKDNTLKIIDNDSKEIVTTITDAKKYVETLKEIEDIVPAERLKIYLVEAMPLEKLLFIRDSLRLGKNNPAIAELSTAWKQDWNCFQALTTLAHPNKNRNKYWQLLRDNTVLQNDITVTRYDNYDFLNAISIDDTSLGTKIKDFIETKATQAELDDFVLNYNGIIKNPNFVPCNLNTVTQSYAGNSSRKIIFNIHLPAGTQCLYIDDIVSTQDMLKPFVYQSELVVNKGQWYNISRMRLSDDKQKMIIDLDVILQKVMR